MALPPIAISTLIPRQDAYTLADTTRGEVSYILDFTNAASYQLDFGQAQASGIFGVPRTLFLDNSQNPSTVFVTVGITNQQYPIPPFTAGWFPITGVLQSKILLESNGGGGPASIIVYSYQIPGLSYSGFGPITPGLIQGIYGQDGATIMSPVNPFAVKPYRSTGVQSLNATLAPGAAQNIFPGGGPATLNRFRNVGGSVAYYHFGAPATGSFAAGDFLLQPGDKVELPYTTSLSISFYSANGTNIEAEAAN